MVEVGQKVRFDPCYNVTGFCARYDRGNIITGTVVMVNREHRWFSVEYGKQKLRTSFKFVDIGGAVHIL